MYSYILIYTLTDTFIISYSSHNFNQKEGSKMFAKKKKSSDAEEQLQQDKHLIVAIQPQGGITFSDEKLIKTGDGYEIILHIYRYPKYIDKFWLTQIVNIDNVVVTIDIETKDQ